MIVNSCCTTGEALQYLHREWGLLPSGFKIYYVSTYDSMKLMGLPITVINDLYREFGLVPRRVRVERGRILVLYAIRWRGFVSYKSPLFP